MISRCSYYELTALATQLHGGFSCAWYCGAKIASSRLPVEKNRPRTPQSAPTTMGCPLPSRKVPLTQQVSRPPPHPMTHSSPSTLPTRCLLRSSKRGRGRTPQIIEPAGHKKSSRRRTTTNRRTFSSPLLRAHPRETTTQQNVDVLRIERRER